MPRAQRFCDSVWRANASSASTSDMVNVSFRIASIAGREGRPDILATHFIKLASRAPFKFGEPETVPVPVPVKGRIGTETIYGVSSA